MKQSTLSLSYNSTVPDNVYVMVQGKGTMKQSVCVLCYNSTVPENV